MAARILALADTTESNSAPKTESSPELFKAVHQALLAAGASPDPNSVVEALRDKQVLLSHREIEAITNKLQDEMLGFGPLQPLFAEPGLTDVLVNAPDSVFIDAGRGLRRASITFDSEAQVRALAQRLANQLNARLDEARPYFEARTQAGWRVHIITPPISGSYTRISVRTPSEKVWTIQALIDTNTCTDAQAQELIELIESRGSFLVSGATGAGKTTVLSALIGAVAPEERVVIVEDTPELRPAHPHVIHLHTRAANIEGAGGVDMSDLVRQSLRMRPDRLVVGEVRGPEVADLLNAFNTGHRGGGTTIHANSAFDSLARINLLGLMAGLPARAIREQIGVGLDAVIHVARDASFGRRITEIASVSKLLSRGALQQ
jgi:pilus assembly protein CpaF